VKTIDENRPQATKNKTTSLFGALVGAAAAVPN
jgi:hypothetical protein